MAYTAKPKLPRIEEGVPLRPATRHALRPTMLMEFVQELRAGDSFVVPQSRASGFAAAFGRALIPFERRPEKPGWVRFWRVRKR